MKKNIIFLCFIFLFLSSCASLGGNAKVVAPENSFTLQKNMWAQLWQKKQYLRVLADIANIKNVGLTAIGIEDQGHTDLEKSFFKAVQNYWIQGLPLIKQQIEQNIKTKHYVLAKQQQQALSFIDAKKAKLSHLYQKQQEHLAIQYIQKMMKTAPAYAVYLLWKNYLSYPQQDLYNHKWVCQFLIDQQQWWFLHQLSLAKPKLVFYQAYKHYHPPGINDSIDTTLTIRVNQGLKNINGVGVPQMELGSGFYIDNQGDALTNYHVIRPVVDPQYRGYAQLTVSSAEEPHQWIPAKVLGYDPLLDLALIKVPIHPSHIACLHVGKSIKVGAKVSVIGSPLALSKTLTTGIISSVGRNVGNPLGFDLQIDAPINSGNSGGPVFNQQGQVVGIAFMKANIPGLNVEGIGFAIPMAYVLEQLKQLYQAQKVHHTYLGGIYWSAKKNKIRVLFTLGSGPLSQLHLKENTTILKWDEKKITTIDQLFQQVLGSSVGTLHSIVYQEDQSKKIHKQLVWLKERPDNLSLAIKKENTDNQLFYPYLGIHMQLKNWSAQTYYIDYVLAGSLADQLGIKNQNQVKILKSQLNSKNIWKLIFLVKSNYFTYFDKPVGLQMSLEQANVF